MQRHGRRRKKQSAVRRFWKGLGQIFGRKDRGKARTTHYQVAVPAFQRNASANQRLVSPRLINMLLLVVSGWLLYWFSSADIFYVQDFQIEGQVRVEQADLVKASGLEGVNIFWVDTRTVERALEALPEVKSAEVRCSLPADCVVRVVEHAAWFVWRQGESEVWIGANGVVLPARGELPNPVVLDAVESTALKPGDRLDLELVNAVDELTWLQPEVRVYQYAERYGLSFRNAYGWPVRLGHGKNIETKLALVRALTAYLADRGITPAFIDVRYPDAPYYGQ